jgi:Uma2 family endonuclease
MATIVTDPLLEDRIRAQRAETGADRYDEVWEGTYFMAPLPNNDHQELVGDLASILRTVVKAAGLGKVYPGANISDRDADWEFNFRGPDIVVVLQGGRAKDRGTHFVGGPDFLVEVASRFDRSREKLPFYGKIGVRELMLIDRDPWCIELYRLEGAELRLVGKSLADDSTVVTSAVIPLSFRLLPGEPRPEIEAKHSDGVQRWVV